MTFKELDLIEPILKALQQTGYTTPTPIQEQAIPVLLKVKICWDAPRQEQEKQQRLLSPLYNDFINQTIKRYQSIDTHPDA